MTVAKGCNFCATIRSNYYLYFCLNSLDEQKQTIQEKVKTYVNFKAETLTLSNTQFLQ